jgi:hypothetical protein
MQNKIIFIKHRYCRTIFFGFLFILNIYSSENEATIPNIPFIEILPSITSAQNIILFSTKNEPQDPISICSQAIFEVAIKNKLFSNIIEYSPGKKDVTLYLSVALTIFNKAIITNEKIYFKDCPQLKEILFPPRSASPLKNLNAHNSPKSTSPVYNRRASGSIVSSPFFNKFSVDPDMTETPKDLILKTPAHKNLVSFIIAHCMVTLQPDILQMLYDQLKAEAYKIVKQHTDYLEKNKKTGNETQQTDEPNYTLLEEQYNALEKNKNVLETEIENYITTIKELNKKLQEKSNAAATSSNGHKTEIATLESKIESLQILITTSNDTINKYKNTQHSDMQSLNDARNQIKAHEKTISFYKLCTGIGLTFNVLLCILLLYQNYFNVYKLNAQLIAQ